MRKLIERLIRERGAQTTQQMADEFRVSKQNINYYVRVMGLRLVGHEKQGRVSRPLYDLPEDTNV